MWLWILTLLILLPVGIVLTFIANLYAPTVLWVLSYAALFASPLMGFIVKKKSSIVMLCCALAIVINMNFLALMVISGSLLSIGMIYALGLTLTLILILYVMAFAVRQFRSRAAA